MKLVTKVTNIFDGIVNLLALLAAALLIFLMLGVSTEIVMRNFMGRAIVWMLEVSGFSLLYITFLVAPWVLRREGHVRMDLVLNRLKPRTQSMLNIITSIVGAIICLVITWYGVMVTWEYFQLGYFESYAMLHPPKFLLLLIIPVGSLMLFIQFLRRSYGYFESWRALRDKEQGL